MGRPSQVVKGLRGAGSSFDDSGEVAVGGALHDRRQASQQVVPDPDRTDRYRGSLLQAVQSGDRFVPVSGEPESWQPALRDVRVREWARRWLGEQWQEWQPRTRASAVEALARFLTSDRSRREATRRSARLLIHGAETRL